MTARIAEISQRRPERLTLMAAAQKVQDFAKTYVSVLLVPGLIAFGFWTGALLVGIQKDQEAMSKELTAIGATLEEREDEDENARKELKTRMELMDIRLRHLEVEAEVAKRLEGVSNAPE